MFAWLKRLFFGDSNAEPESKSDIREEQPRSSSDIKKAKKKYAREHGRRQRARERALSREFNKEDSRWIARGGFSYGGGGA